MFKSAEMCNSLFDRVYTYNLGALEKADFHLESLFSLGIRQGTIGSYNGETISGTFVDPKCLSPL